MAHAAPDQVGLDTSMEDNDCEEGSSTLGGGPGAYGEQQAQDGVEFVVLNDDVLTSVANATMVLVDGSDLEKMAVLYQFPQFLEHCPGESVSVMVPVICSNSVDWRDDLQMAAAEALYYVVNIPLPEPVVKQIIVCTLTIIQKPAPGADVFDACGEILSMMLPQVQRQDVLDLVVPATTERAAASTAESRRLAARIIGSLSDTMTADEIENMFLSRSLDLAADHDASVRAMIAQSMASVGAKLPLHVSERFLWPILKTLMYDPNARVRAAAVRAIARSAEAHKDHSSTATLFRTMLLPMFMSECTKAGEIASTDLRTVDDDTYLMLEIFAEVYGYFLCAVASLLKKDETWVASLNTLRRMVTCNGPTVRHWCAFNMPAVASICADERTDKIKGVLQALSVDSDVETRATLASGIHETTRLLGTGPLREEVIQAISDLISDSNPQVRTNSLVHFSKLLHLLVLPSDCLKTSKNSTPVDAGVLAENCSRDVRAKDLAPILSSLEVMSTDSWRTQELLASEIRLSAHIIPQDMLCDHVAPLLFQMARESTYLVRRASMQALIHVVRHIPDVKKRNHILKHFRVEWAHGKVYWTRLAYIDGLECAQKVFSWKLFAELFKDELLTMADDPVANVRLRLARMFPSLVARWRKSGEFVEVLRKLSADDDAQVTCEAERQLGLLQNISDPTPEEIQRNEVLEESEEVFFIQKGPKKSKKPQAVISQEKPVDQGLSGELLPVAEKISSSSADPQAIGDTRAEMVSGDQAGTGSAVIPEKLDSIQSGLKDIGQNASVSKARSNSKRGSVLKRGFCGCFGRG